MKKLLAAACVVGVTLIVPGAAFADENKLPGGRPPCSIIRKSPASPAYDSFCNSFP